VNEDTWSLGAEYTSTALHPITVVAGLGFDALIPNHYWADSDELAKALGARYYAVRSGNRFLRKWQLAATWEMARGQELRLSYARKNHFPTMAQRYSTRFGDVLPNPGLGAEIANHLELGYRGALGSVLRLATSIYYSLLTDKIVNIELPDPQNPSAPVDYARNLDRVSFYGVETTVEAHPVGPLTIGAAASVQRYALNRSYGRDVKVMPYYPEVTANAFATIRPFTAVTLIPRFEYLGARYADSAGLEKLGAYWLAALKASVELGPHLSLAASVTNPFDRYYEIQKRSPMAGRSFGLSCVIEN
jgi:iron complex outermembrane recepter protein